MGNQNGIIIQSLKNKTNIVRSFVYDGIYAYHLYPLCWSSDKECIALTKQQQSKEVETGFYVSLDFISNVNLYKQYTKKCAEMGIPIRSLFIESDYDMEIWQEPLPPMRFLGYEYSPMPLDVQIISDIEWHKPFETYRQLLNEHGLFSSYEHAVEFAKVYQSVAAMGEVGDGLEDAYICRVSEVESSNMCIEEKVRKVIP